MTTSREWRLSTTTMTAAGNGRIISPNRSVEKWRQRSIQPKSSPDFSCPSSTCISTIRSIKGGDENIRPQRVFDDGSKTYIQMSANVANREVPVLMVVGADGK
jgi:hypothetical protein